MNNGLIHVSEGAEPPMTFGFDGEAKGKHVDFRPALSLIAAGHTLQPTALVHEAWLRLVGKENAKFKNRAHFFAAAAEAMRRILIDKAQSKRSRIGQAALLRRHDVRGSGHHGSIEARA